MRLVIVDDHRVVREGLRYMLGSDPDVEIVAEADSGEALLELLRTTEVDVVLLDVRMPGLGGLGTLEALSAEHPDVRVLMLTMHDEPAYLRRAVELGAAGYLLKSAGRDEVLRGLRTVAAGGVFVQGDLMRTLVAEVAGEREGSDRLLSPREREVLQLVADGLENKQIARHLGIAEATVKGYLRDVFERLGVSGRAEAVAVALRLGLIE